MHRNRMFHRPPLAKTGLTSPGSGWTRVAAGTEKGIRDTYAWKESVRKFGLQETRKMLKLGLLSRKLPDHNPMN